MDTRKVRLMSDMTQSQLAEAIKVSRQSVCDYENYKTNSKRVETRIREYYSTYDFKVLSSDKSIEKRKMNENLQSAILIVKDMMDKVGVCL